MLLTERKCLDSLGLPQGVVRDICQLALTMAEPDENAGVIQRSLYELGNALRETAELNETINQAKGQSNA